LVLLPLLEAQTNGKVDQLLNYEVNTSNAIG